MDDFDDLWDDDDTGATITAPYEAPEGGYVHHRFIVGPDGQVYKGGGGDNEFHEDIAAQHGISSPRDPGAHLTGPYALGTAYNHGGMEIHQNNGGLDHAALQAALEPHFPDYQVPTEGLATGQDQRWPTPRNPAEKAEQLMPDFDQKKRQEQQAVEERGRPYRYYENPFFNRGGKVSNDVQCQNCGYVATGPGYNQEVCEACGAPQPYAHQPNPTHSEMEMRNMPAPGEEDAGGNPLQEGILADGGWQNRMKRDESFASVKKAGDRGPFDMSDGEYPLPSGGQGQYQTCPNCKEGQMSDQGECYRCGYTIPYDGGEILDGHSNPAEWANDVRLPHVDSEQYGLGPIRQGAAPFNEAEEEYEMDLEREKQEVAERIAAWDRMAGMRNNFYMPWDQNEEVIEAVSKDQKLAAQLTSSETSIEKKSGLMSLITGAGGGMAGAEAGAALGAPLGPVGMAVGGLAGRLLGGAVGRAIGGGGGQAPAQAPQPAINQPWNSLSSVHAQLVQGEYEHPSSNPGFDDTDDPEDVDQHEHNDGEHAPETDDGQGSDGFAPEVMHALQLAEPALEHYMQSDESGANDPSIAALVKVLNEHHPELLEMGNDPDPEVEAMFDNHLVKESDPEPSAVGHKTLSYAPGIGGMMPQPAPGTQMLQNPVAQPGGQVAPQTQGSCPSCGARVTPGQGVCPQCNAAIDPTPDTATAVNPQAPVGPAGQAVPPVMASIHNRIIDERFSANQGPHNPEQMQAVKQYLVDQGRPELVSDLIDHPENYGDILAEIQNKQHPANPDPDPGPAPMPPQGMPPGMPPQGGDPSQGQMPMMAAVHGLAPKCPNCDSHTTEIMVSDIDPGNFQCHNCGHTWKRNDVVPTKTGAMPEGMPQDPFHAPGRTCYKCGGGVATADGRSFCTNCGANQPDPNTLNEVRDLPEYTAFEHDDLHAHDLAAPAADQVRPDDPAKDDNPGGAWSTQDGQPLVVGQEYEMYSAKYDVPDVVRIEAVKPDSIEYTLTGEYGLEHRTEVSKQEADMDGITFLPTSEHDADPEAQMNEQGAPDATMQAPQPVQASTQYEDDLWDDSRYASIRTAGAKFTPMEQSEFIDEKGTARNADKLDLSGTHYEAREQAGLSDDLFLFGL